MAASTTAAKSTPKDAQIMAAILKDMGVNEYEPRVINQMLEFSYRYISDVLGDAKVYSTHASKKSIDLDDLKLATQCKLDHSYTNPPPRDLLMDVARHKNSIPLPLIKPFTGPKLPPDRYCLMAPNYRLKSIKKPRVQVQTPGIMQSSGSLPRLSLASPSFDKSSHFTSRPASQTIGIRPLTNIRSSAPTPLVRVIPAASLAPSVALTSAPSLPSNAATLGQLPPLKRKRENDDDDYDSLA